MARFNWIGLLTVAFLIGLGLAPSPQAPSIFAAAPDAAKPRVDAFGDPLPDGAVLRLGTTRWRHGAHITSIFLGQDGTVMSVGSEGLKVWDRNTGAVIHRVGHTEDCTSSHGWVTPDCKKLVTTYYLSANLMVIAREMRVWDIATGRLIHSLGDRVHAGVAFTANSKIAAFYNTNEAKRDGIDSVLLWDISTGTKIAEWDAQQEGVAHAVFTPDGKTLITGGGDKSIRFWDVPSGQEKRRLNSSGEGAIGLVALSVDGKWLATIDQKVPPANQFPKSPPRSLPGYSFNRVRIWDLAAGKQVHELIAALDGKAYSLNGFTAAAFTPDSKFLVTAGPDQFTRVWDVAKGAESRRMDLQSGWGMTLSPDGKTVAAIASGGGIRLADFDTGKPSFTAGHSGQPMSAQFARDGNTIITTGRKPTFIAWDARTGKERTRFGSESTWAAACEISKDGRSLSAVCVSGVKHKTVAIETWDIATGKLSRAVPLADGIRAGWLSPDLTVMAATTWQKPIVTLVSTTTGKPVKEFDTGKVPYTNAFIEGGRTMLVGVDNHTIQVWDIAKGEKRREIPALGPTRGRGLLLTLDGPNTSWFRLHISNDEKLLAYAHGNEPLIVLYDLAKSKEVLRLADLAEAPHGVAISPDNTMFAWAGLKDPSIHIVDIPTGRELRKLTGHGSHVVGLSFSHDNKRLVSCSSDGTALVWDVTPN